MIQNKIIKMEAFHIEFIIFLISLIFIDKRLTNYDLIRLLIIFFICTSDLSEDKDKFSECKNDNNDNYRSIQNGEDEVIIDDKTISPQDDKTIKSKNERKKFFKGTDSLKYNKGYSLDKIKLIDILKKRYKGVSITVSLVNSSEFTGEVVNVYKGILVIKGSNITYYIDGDYIVSFF